MTQTTVPQITGYDLLEQIGQGGMGIVYRARDVQSGEAVAIKVLKSDAAQDDLIARFVREGEALRQLNHPNIVKMLRMVQERNQHCLVMEYVEGGSLSTLLKKEAPLPIQRVLNIALDIADALTRAHRLNIIHRDIKPDNILIAADGMPRLTDFGIAQMSDALLTTNPDVIVGTVAYLSPEGLGGNPASPLTDIWAFGVVLFEMLTGQRPFPGTNLQHQMTSILTEPVPDLEKLRPDVPLALIDLVYRMLAKSPAERIPSIRLVGAELEALLRGTIYDTPRAGAKVTADDEQTVIERGRFATPTPTAQAIKHNLPVQSTAFVGREHEIQNLVGLINSPKEKLITIIAPGGMGKTRLALEVATHFAVPVKNNEIAFPDGVFFVELAPLDQADSIPMAVAEAVGYPFQQDSRSPQTQLVDYFREKAQLIVFDNFEHIIEGRSFVQAVLQAAPQVKILATSRERLNLSSETLFNLEGMDFPQWETPADALEYAAVKLFMQSARRVRPDFELTADDLAYIARICRLVRGMPLGIVLAAAWLESLSLHEIADEIIRSLDFLETNMQDVPERQRSLRAVFEYSWHLLSDEERSIFAALSIFHGGMTREAAQQVSGASLRSLQTLINKSLLTRDNMTGRYEIHELLRQYAEDYLKQSGTWDDARNRHAAYFAKYLSDRDSDLKGRRQMPAIHEIEADFENIKAAWHWLLERRNAEQINSMIESLFWFATFRSRQTEAEAMFREARAVWPSTVANPSLLSGRLLVRFPDRQRDMAPTFEQGLAIARQHNHAPEIAFCLRLLGHWISHSTYNQEVGIPLLMDSLKTYQGLHDDYYAALVLDDLGWSYRLEMHVQEQIDVIQQALELRRKLGDKIGVANSLRNMGGAAGGYGSGSDEPLAYWTEALALAKDLGDRSSIAWNTHLIGAFWLFRARFDEARPWMDESLRLATEINESTIIGLCFLNEGIKAAVVDNDYDRARQFHREGYPEGGSGDMRELNALILDMIIYAGTDDYASMKHRMLNQRWALANLSTTAPLTMPFVACFAAYHKQPALAAELLGKAFTSPGYNALVVIHWAVLKRLKANLEAELGTEGYRAALKRGEERPVEELVEASSALINNAP